MDDLARLSMQYCARSNATAMLELWALLLALHGAATVALFTARRLPPDRRFAAQLCAGAMLFFAFVTFILAASIFYGCSATAASEQGLGSPLTASTYKLLRCLGTDTFGTAQGWTAFVASSTTAIVLAVAGVFRRRSRARIPAFAGAAVLAIIACACGFFLFFGFSWCTSERLI